MVRPPTKGPGTSSVGPRVRLRDAAVEAGMNGRPIGAARCRTVGSHRGCCRCRPMEMRGAVAGRPGLGRPRDPQLVDA
eukprot:15464277-Alexandrium_andersonii.AAC.1